MLRTVVAVAGFKQLFESAQTAAGSASQADALAAVPLAIAHVALEAYHPRPVQAQLVRALLAPRDEQQTFANCVLIHGMGGTGKTVMAVAAVREHAVRAFFREIHWLTVGADAIGERIKQLAAMLVSVLPRRRRIRSCSS